MKEQIMGLRKRLNELTVFLIALILLLFGMKSYAQSGTTQNADFYLNEITELINKAQLENDISYKIGEVSVSDNCQSFMDSQLFLGANGFSIFNSFIKNSSRLPNLLAGGSLVKYCPKYPKMSLDNKALVWVALLTMISHFESSCNANSKNKGGPNGTAKGYYQLHLGKENIYDGNEDFCKKNSSLNPNQSHICTLGMLELQYQKQNMELFSSKSYWDVLRPKGRA